MSNPKTRERVSGNPYSSGGGSPLQILHIPVNVGGETEGETPYRFMIALCLVSSINIVPKRK